MKTKRLRIIGGLFVLACLTSTTFAIVGGKSANASAGDAALIEFTIWDAAGVPVFASNETYAGELLTLSGAESLVAAGRPALGAAWVTVGSNSTRPGDLTRLFSEHLIGRGESDEFSTPIAHHLFGDWSTERTVPALRGPFNLTQTVNRSIFHDGYPTAAVGDDINLTFGVRATAKVLAITEDTVTYRSDLIDDEIRMIDRIGVPVRVEIDGETFHLRMIPEPGSEFSVRGSCGPPFYDLELGSYRVVATGYNSILLQHAETPYPPLVGKDLFAQVKVLDIRHSWLEPIHELLFSEEIR